MSTLPHMSPTPLPRTHVTDSPPIALNSMETHQPEASTPGAASLHSEAGEALWARAQSFDTAPQSLLLSSDEARLALKVLQEAGHAAPAAQDVQELEQQSALHAAHTELVQQAKGALVGAQEPPSAPVWHDATASVLAGVFGARGQNFKVARENVTAYVFLVMLQAQRAAIEEKRTSLYALKMHSAMLEDLNNWVARVVVPAQRAINQKIKDGNGKDSLAKRSKARVQAREARVEETIAMPEELDTQWGAIDEETGQVYIPALKDGATTPMKLDSQDMAQLIMQTDNWRATMRNNQNKQSMDFKRIDDAMSSVWNMLNAFLKAAHDAANAIIRNGLG